MTTEASRKHTLAASVHRAIMHRQTVEHVEEKCAQVGRACVGSDDQFTARCFETSRERGQANSNGVSFGKSSGNWNQARQCPVSSMSTSSRRRGSIFALLGARDTVCIRVSGKTAKEEKGSHLHGFPLPGARRIRGEHPVQPAAAAKVAGAYEYRALHNPSLASRERASERPARRTRSVVHAQVGKLEVGSRRRAWASAAVLS